MRIFLDPLKFPDQSWIHSLGEKAHFRVQFLEERPIELFDIRVNGVCAELGAIDGHNNIASLSIAVMPELANKELVATAKVRDGDHLERVNVPISPSVLPTKGVILRDVCGDEIIHPSSFILAGQLPYLKPIFPVGDSQWRLFQDSSDKGYIGPRLGSLSKVKDDAFGIGLWIAKGKFNHIDSERIHLCSAVVPETVIGRFEIADGLAKIQLKTPLEPSEDHQLLIWTLDHGISALLRPKVHYGSEGLTWSWPKAEGTALAVGIGYRGKCIAAWFAQIIGQGIQNEEDSQYLAMAIRWLGLPVGLDVIKRPLIKRAQQDPVAFVRAWILGNEDGTLAVDPSDPSWSHWDRAARIILRDIEWHGQNMTEDLIQEKGLTTCADGFLRRLPQLFRKALVPYLSTEQKIHLLDRYSEVNESSRQNPQALRHEMEMLRDAAAAQFEVDPNFIASLVERIALPGAPLLQRRNGDMALDGSQDFRRLFALRVLLNDIKGIR